MIITAEEYREMGFTAEDDSVLESCLQRAEYTLMGLTEGRLQAALAAGGMAADYVRQAAGFQTCKLVKEHQLGNGSHSEKVTIGDYSYAVSETEAYDAVYDMSMQAVRLLKAAGCLFGGREVCG